MDPETHPNSLLPACKQCFLSTETHGRSAWKLQDDTLLIRAVRHRLLPFPGRAPSRSRAAPCERPSPEAEQERCAPRSGGSAAPKTAAGRPQEEAPESEERRNRPPAPGLESRPRPPSPSPAAPGRAPPGRAGPPAPPPHLFMIWISSAQRSRLRGLSSWRHCLMASCSPLSCGDSAGPAQRGPGRVGPWGGGEGRPAPTLLCHRMTLPKPPVPRRSFISQGPQVCACRAGGRLMAGPRRPGCRRGRFRLRPGRREPALKGAARTPPRPSASPRLRLTPRVPAELRGAHGELPVAACFPCASPSSAGRAETSPTAVPAGTANAAAGPGERHRGDHAPSSPREALPGPRVPTKPPNWADRSVKRQSRLKMG